MTEGWGLRFWGSVAINAGIMLLIVVMLSWLVDMTMALALLFAGIAFWFLIGKTVMEAVIGEEAEC